MDKKYSKDTDLKEIITPYLHRWKYFVGFVLLMLILAIYFIKSTAPVYKAQTSVLIKDAKNMSSASGDFGILQSLGGFGGMGTNSIENEIGIFQSKSIIEDVLKDFNFQTPVFSKQTFYNLELYKNTNPYVIHVIQEKKDADLPKKPIYISTKNNEIVLSCTEWEDEIKSTFDKTISLPFAVIMISKNPNYVVSKDIKMDNVFFTYNDYESTVTQYQEMLEVDLLDKEGTIISISANFKNKEKAKDFLNRLVVQYNIYASKDKNIESKKTKDFIDNRITLISKELGNVESQKEGFKSSNNIVDLATEARISLQQKEQSKAQLLEIGTQIELNRILQGALNRKGSSDVLPLNIGLENEAAAKVIQEYNALVLQKNKYLENATPDHPLVRETTQQIEQIKSSLAQSLQKNVTSLELARNKVEDQLGASQNNIGKIPTQEKLFRNIERQQQIKENLYLLLLQKREEAAISLEITADKARTIDKAFIYKKPVAPKKVLILLFFLILGFFIPFAIIYIKELLQTSIVKRSDITKATLNPILAEIPRLKSKESSLISFNDISPMAEAFRIFATNLKFMLGKNDDVQTIMVTSSVKGEGKTFVSANLSIVLASGRSRVLVVGADVRNPQLQRYNPSMKLAKGLSEFLGGEDLPLNEIIHPSGYNENCDFLYSGAIPPNPTDLLENGRLEVLLHQIKELKKYKYIILDTAPLMLVTDSFIIVDKSDVVVYVTRANVTEKVYLEFMNEAVANKKLLNVGIVLNGVEEDNFGYGNKYGYGYHADKKKWWKRG